MKMSKYAEHQDGGKEGECCDFTKREENLKRKDEITTDLVHKECKVEKNSGLMNIEKFNVDAQSTLYAETVDSEDSGIAKTLKTNLEERIETNDNHQLSSSVNLSESADSEKLENECFMDSSFFVGKEIECTTRDRSDTIQVRNVL